MSKLAYYTGKLRKNDNGRWTIVTEDGGVQLSELSCGSTVEVKIGEHWIATGIEHGLDYYPTTNGVRLYNGMPARQRIR